MQESSAAQQECAVFITIANNHYDWKTIYFIATEEHDRTERVYAKKCFRSRCGIFYRNVWFDCSVCDEVDFLNPAGERSRKTNIQLDSTPALILLPGTITDQYY